MTPKQAIAAGFTHHAIMYGIPVWITEVELIPVVIKAKKDFMEPVLTVIEAVVKAFYFLTRTERRGLYLLVGPRIQETDDDTL
jgi:actin-like ATPase involved in cell morphogenesis